MDEFKNYVSDLGHPYFWAQCLAGLEFARLDEKGTGLPPPTIPNSKLSFNHMEQIMFAVKERLNARVVLQKILHDLGNARTFFF